MYSIRVEADFAAAHFLSHYHGKCERLHGHNYRVRAWARGKDLDEGGMLVDFGELKAALASSLALMDHYNLNDDPRFSGDPSAERIAKAIFDDIRSGAPRIPLWKVEVFETDRSMACFEAD